MITITLNEIRRHHPCENGWAKLLAHLGKTKADDEPFPLVTVLDSNGLEDCLWCFRCLGPEHHGWMRHFAVDCAEDVKHLLTDPRSMEALRVARLYADGKATDVELAAARDAAMAAARNAASAVAWVAAWVAARAAAWDAAWDVSMAAAKAAAAAWDAAWVAARERQSTRLREYLTREAGVE